VARPVTVDVPRLALDRTGALGFGTRRVPEETAVALTFNGTGHAVMMATPADLEDFAVGFALTEGIIERAADVDSIEVADLKAGIELRLWIAEHRMARLAERRRRMAGPVGCGLCGIESLEEAMRSVPQVSAALVLTPAEIAAAVAAITPAQVLGRETRAAHAAGFWRPGASGPSFIGQTSAGQSSGSGAAGGALLALREDVGRHNALDKLVGALARDGIAAAAGAIVVTSRLSVEMVQKTAVAGCGVLVAVSAPTALAIRAAEAAGMTLIGIARGGEFEVFTHARRIAGFAPPGDETASSLVSSPAAPLAKASHVA
jgi:FdhD protein